jgi:hypothetical protein
MIIELSDDEARELYRWFESGDGAEYWISPLGPVQRQLSDWYECKYKSEI